MKSKIKHLIINKPAFYLSPNNYALFIRILSKIVFIFGKSYYLNFREIRSKFDSNFTLVLIDNLDRPIKIQSKMRISRFMKGFYNSGIRQWNRYELDNLLDGAIPENFIDIGANIGEVTFCAFKKGIFNVLAIEPDPIAMECLEFNLEDTRVTLDQRPLNSIEEMVTFYLKTDSADSSLFKPDGESLEINVQATTLDNLFHEHGFSGNTLIKMDAEGFEPEVLRGGINALKKVKWISIDAGEERAGSSTVHEVLTILKNVGFDKIEVSKLNIVTAKRF